MILTKKIISLTLLFLIISCSRKDKNNSNLKSSNLEIELLQKKKNELGNHIAQLNSELETVNNSINKIDSSQKLPLITAFTLSTEPFYHEIEIQANIKTRQNIEVYPELNGELKNIFVKEGTSVVKGQLLGIIDDSGLKDQLDQLKLQLSLSKTSFERIQRLWGQKIGSEMNFLEAKTRYESQVKMVSQMKEQLSKTKILAPFKGIIDEIIARKGQMLAPTMTPVLRIINLDAMYVEANVPENYLPNITIGSKATVFIPVIESFQKTIIRQTGNYINPNNRTFRVEAPIKNPDKIIKPNLTARLIVNDYSNLEALMIPLRIINENANGKPYVYTLTPTDEKSVFITKKMFLEFGKSNNDKIEVFKGLSIGDLIIDEGALIVEEKQKVQIIKN